MKKLIFLIIIATVTGLQAHALESCSEKVQAAYVSADNYLLQSDGEVADQNLTESSKTLAETSCLEVNFDSIPIEGCELTDANGNKMKIISYYLEKICSFIN